jgi:ketol-acid reductoisomerase
MNAERQLTEDSLLEQTGKELRKMMPWITKNKIVNPDEN